MAALGLRLRGAGAAVEPRGEADAQQPASGLSGGQVVLPNLSLILDVAAAAFRGPRGPSGAHDPVGNGFTLQQLELHLDAAVDPYLDLQANVVFTLGGVEVEEAYARTLALPLRSQLRAGQFLTRTGRTNATHPHTWHFADQPAINTVFLGMDGHRGLGLELSWLAPLPFFVELLGSATMAGPSAGHQHAHASGEAQDSGAEAAAEPARELTSPRDLTYNLRLEQFHELGDAAGLLIGLGALLRPYAGSEAHAGDVYVADVMLRYRDPSDPQRRAITLQSEWMLRRTDHPDGVHHHGGTTTSVVAQVAQRWEVGARFEHLREVELHDDHAAHDDGAGAANAGGDGAGDAHGDLDLTRTRTSAQLTFYPSHFSRIRLQLAHDYRGGGRAHGYAAFLAFEALIGAHGAHGYDTL